LGMIARAVYHFQPSRFGAIHHDRAISAAAAASRHACGENPGGGIYLL